MFNIPNLITFARILSIPFVVFFLYEPNKNRCLYGAAIFLFAALTDWVDGYVARQTNTVTNFGKFLDPLADKLLVTSALILLLYHQWIPVWVVLVILMREMVVMGLRNIVAAQGVVIAASFLGKIKTFFQMFAIVLLLIHYRYNITEPYYISLNFHSIGYDFLMIAVAITILSGIDYVVRLRKYLKG
jgi:CDP-diacylglycerol--glycerol-3-phosphate 3-phosphatidyltransferase